MKLFALPHFLAANLNYRQAALNAGISGARMRDRVFDEIALLERTYHVNFNPWRIGHFRQRAAELAQLTQRYQDEDSHTR